MKVLITKDQRRPIKILAPNKLVLFIIKRAIISNAKSTNRPLERSQKRKLKKILKICLKTYNNWKLVEVISSSGEKIEVYL